MFYGYDLLYTREHYFAPFFRNVVLEKHHLPKVFTDFHRFFFTKARNIIVITSFLKDRLINLGIASENIYIAPDSVDPDDFKDVPGIAESRAKLGLSVTDNIFGYYGTLKTMGMEKGVKTGIDSLQFLPESYKFYVVGGDPVDVAFYKSYADSVKMSNRVIFAGRISLKDRPLYIGACESMVAPFPVNEHYSYFMSPLKIFEYMASKRPIIVSDLPTLKEILEENVDALFVPPERPDLLAEAIKKLKEDEGLRNKLVENAYRKVLDKYTWKARAEGIINFVNR
jgi:glycosyltransferase involved in cell wall biosynthesis